MRKKRIISAILASSVVCAAALGGCSLVSSNNKADMEQVISTVDISEAKYFNEEFEDLKEVFDSAIGETKIIKRELVSYFLNVGPSYINSNYSYAETFNILVDALDNTAVLAQYSTLYLLSEKQKEDSSAIETFKNLESEAAKYEYLLGEDSDDVKVAKYTWMSSINGAIDYRENLIIEGETSVAGSDTRTAPGNVDTEREDYYPEVDGNLDYNVYTGFKGYLLSESGAYKDDALDGTNRFTRLQAYNDYISYLKKNHLVDADEEDISDVLSLNCIIDDYVSQLKSRVINKYYEQYESEQEAELKDENGEYKFEYIQKVYNDILALQKEKYEEESEFSTVVGEMSDSKFVLYAPETENSGNFGFVYNILLPYSAAQSNKLTELQTLYADSEMDGGYKEDYYFERAQLLYGIETTDRRQAWFNGATEYAFNAKDAGIEYFGSETRDWLFFENNLTKTDRYESLDKYDGRYAFNGKAVKKDDGSYDILANKLDIDQMLEEFIAYVNYVLTGTNASASYEKSSNYMSGDIFKQNDDGEDEVDYSKFVYATGNVDFGADDADNRLNLLKKTTDTQESSVQYKALSAVNELQYAYTTDVSVLSQYLGYTVEAGDTNYIKEFEYAAQEAIKGGAGSFSVCAGDYGWHLIYVTYTFANGVDQYSPTWDEEHVKAEGTFEYFFYEWIKSENLTNLSTSRSTEILSRYNTDATVAKYEKRYKDLLSLDS